MTPCLIYNPPRVAGLKGWHSVLQRLMPHKCIKLKLGDCLEHHRQTEQLLQLACTMLTGMPLFVEQRCMLGLSCACRGTCLAPL